MLATIFFLLARLAIVWPLFNVPHIVHKYRLSFVRVSVSVVSVPVSVVFVSDIFGACVSRSAIIWWPAVCFVRHVMVFSLGMLSFKQHWPLLRTMSCTTWGVSPLIPCRFGLIASTMHGYDTKRWMENKSARRIRMRFLFYRLGTPSIERFPRILSTIEQDKHTDTFKQDKAHILCVAERWACPFFGWFSVLYNTIVTCSRLVVDITSRLILSIFFLTYFESVLLLHWTARTYKTSESIIHYQSFIQGVCINWWLHRTQHAIQTKDFPIELLLAPALIIIQAKPVTITTRFSIMLNIRYTWFITP